MIFRLILTSAMAAGLCGAACFQVTGGRITGRDLAAADAAFSALPATYTVSVAPEPGTERKFAVAELRRVAAANRLSGVPNHDICFEIPTRLLDSAALETAMRRSLAANAALKIVEVSKTPAPAGEIDFPLTSLEPAGPGSDGVQLWRGFVRYADTRKAPIWARVLITQHYACVVAIRDLAANTVVPASSLRIDDRTGPPAREPGPARIEDVAGRQLTRAVKAGDPVPVAFLIAPWDVKRGDSVRVEVKSGEARLNLDAIAENSGRQGDMVELRNPSSGKLFRARVEQGGRAVLILATDRGL